MNFPRRIVNDMITGDVEEKIVGDYRLRGVHPTMSKFHIIIYDEDDNMIATLDGDNYKTPRKMWNACRRQIGMDKKDEGLGDLFG